MTLRVTIAAERGTGLNVSVPAIISMRWSRWKDQEKPDKQGWRFVHGLSQKYHMSGENLAKFLLGTLDRVRERALGLLGS